MKRLLWVIGAASFLVLAFWSLSMHLKIYRFFSPHLDRQIAASLTISPEWVEISPVDALTADRQVQQVVLYVESPLKADKQSWGLLLPSGSLVIPEVQIVTQDGETYRMTDPSFIVDSSSSNYVQRGFGNHNLPKDKLYRAVRIRCDEPVPVSKVVWRCYDPRDRK